MLHTATQMHPAVGTIGTIMVEGLHVSVKVLDMRQRWGKIDALISPVNGYGEKWVEASRIHVESDSRAVSNY